MDDLGAHRGEGPLERLAVVVEHSWSHVWRRHHEVEPSRTQPPEQVDAFFRGLHSVIDAGNPVTMQIDKASHDWSILPRQHRDTLAIRWRR
jgi:hypothetical protein